MDRFRAGLLYPISNLIAGTLMCVGMLTVGIVDIADHVTTTSGGALVLAGFSALLALLGFVVGLAIVGSGINSLRPITMGRTLLRVPIFKITRGFSHLEIPLDDVAGVELSYRSLARNGRWQLMIIRLHHPNTYSDSLTSARSQVRGPAGTTAARVTEELRRALPTDRLARWRLP